MIKEYFKEIQGLDFYETEYGFIAYKVGEEKRVNILFVV